jgi:hypothetical protein
MRHKPISTPIRTLLLCGAFLLPLVAAADRRDVTTPTAEPNPTGAPDPVDSILSPDVPLVDFPGPAAAGAGPLPVASLTPGDRGSVGTDGGSGAPPGLPNALEQLKLEMARQAIAVARGATGEGQVTDAAEGLGGPPRAFIRDSQVTTARNLPPAQPALLPTDPVSGVGEDLPSLQEAGPVGLTPQEIEKLSARRDSIASPTDRSSEGRTGRREGR